MKEAYRQFLFHKGYLVHQESASVATSDEVVLSLLTLFGIRITEGHALADKEMIGFCEDELGIRVPLPFYRGFPDSLRALSPDALLFDQLVHYTKTYGFGQFDEAGHSIMERYVERVQLEEQFDIDDVKIITEKEAENIMKDAIASLLSSSRPLSESQLTLIKAYVEDYTLPCAVASKNTAIRLFLDTENILYAESLALSDVIKVAEYLNYRRTKQRNIRKLNLKNTDRKLLAALMDYCFESGVCNIRECFEKKALWNGLLHHIHYKPKTQEAEAFLKAMRGKGNESVYAAFEKAMLDRDVICAAKILKKGKGGGALLRNLHYLISRCRTVEDVEGVLAMIDSHNVIILLQLLIRYRHYSEEDVRTFKYLRFEQLVIHRENEREARHRKSVLSEVMIDLLRRTLSKQLKAVLKNRVGKVYLEEGMRKIALPIQEGSTMGGLGVLTRGSRLSIPQGKKLRAFVYWEKVDDIDLSVIGIDSDGRQYEYSWRSMAFSQCEAITFSGDETSGYHGGSEYYDIDLDAFSQQFPTIEKLIFNANVYSGIPFGEAVCRAGYMLRDTEDSGEIYEPKTVRSAFSVTCDSTMAHLYALDLTTREFVWMNLAIESNARIAGEESLGYLLPYFDMLSVINVYTFFEMMATEIVEDPADADLVIADGELSVKEGAEVIRSCDYEKIFRYMN